MIVLRKQTCMCCALYVVEKNKQLTDSEAGRLITELMSTSPLTRASWPSIL